MTRIFTFPGQGSQHPGMGKDWFENFSQAKLVFEEASDACGLNLKKLCFEGTDADLKQTQITQPAILTVSVAIFESLKSDQEIKLTDSYFAGHSLGEYSALVAAGALSLADAARTVKKRGELMQQAVPEGLGAMAALIFKPGTNGEAVAVELCQKSSEFSGANVSVANFNSPEQIVVSGHKNAVSALEELVKKETSAGVRKVVPLNVSAPFHCALMKPAADGLRGELDAIAWKNQSGVQYIPNTLGMAVTLNNAKECPARLYDQITGSVQWSQSMKHVLLKGVQEHLEVGPGTVLTGLMKRISALMEGSTLKMNNTATVEAYRGRT